MAEKVTFSCLCSYLLPGIPSSTLMVPVAYHRHPIWYLWPTTVIPYGNCGIPSSSLMVPVAYHHQPLWYLWHTIVIPYGTCGLPSSFLMVTVASGRTTAAIPDVRVRFTTNCTSLSKATLLSFSGMLMQLRWLSGGPRRNTNSLKVSS